MKKNILNILIIILLFTKFAETKNIYLSLFLAKDLELKKHIFKNMSIKDSNEKMSQIAKSTGLLNNIKQNITDKITGDKNYVYHIESKMKILINKTRLNFNEKEILFKHYIDLKKTILNYYLKTGDYFDILKVFIQNNFNQFNKLSFASDYDIIEYQLKELKILLGILHEYYNNINLINVEINFMLNYLNYLYEKQLTTYFDKDINSFKKNLTEIKTIFEFIDKHKQ